MYPIWCRISEDSGFDSRAGFSETRWPNGKASDYEVSFLVLTSVCCRTDAGELVTTTDFFARIKCLANETNRRPTHQLLLSKTHTFVTKQTTQTFR